MSRSHDGHYMRPTSLEAYAELRETLGPRQQEVYEAIKRNPGLTDAELTHLLGYDDPNRVRPRRFELMEMGIIKEGLKRKCGCSGRKALTWFQS